MKQVKQKLFVTLMSMMFCMVILSACALGSQPKQSTEKNEHENQVSEDKTNDNTKSDSDTTPHEESTEADDNPEGQESSRKVAISLPDQSIQRWTDDAENMKRGLEAVGCDAVIAYAENDAKKQAAQIEQFVEAGADCIIIAAVDSKELAEALDLASQARIPVIAYDTLLMDTDAVSFYTSFDQKGAGIMIGQAIIEKAELDHLPAGEYKTIEFFMGDPGDRNARLLYKGLMEALKPYLEEGTLVCRSGRTSMKEASIKGGTQERAQKRCKNYLKKYYMNEDLDICAAALDSLAAGCLAAFTAAGYTVENWPVISGQNCEPAACSNILEGTQTFSVYKDTRVLAQKCVSMVEALLDGTEPEINDIEQYDNHVLIVPSYVCTPVIVDKDNLEETLIDSGYYTKEQIEGAR